MAPAPQPAPTNFDFSYTFGDGQEVVGSFTGTTTNGGQSVTNVGNFQVSLNGIAFAPVTVGGLTYGNATLQANTWNPALPSVTGVGNGAFDDTTPVTIYANGALNNFVISDVDAATNTSPDYEFTYINDATNSIYEAVAANFLQSDAFSTAEGNYHAAGDRCPRQRLELDADRRVAGPGSGGSAAAAVGPGPAGLGPPPPRRLSRSSSFHRIHSGRKLHMQSHFKTLRPSRVAVAVASTLALCSTSAFASVSIVKGVVGGALFTPPVFADTAAASSASSTAASVYAGVTVCFDLNGNGVCDPGEPSTTTSSTRHLPAVELDPGAAGGPGRHHRHEQRPAHHHPQRVPRQCGADQGRHEQSAAGRDGQHHPAVHGSRPGHREPWA